jgi:hypothetical protein
MNPTFFELLMQGRLSGARIDDPVFPEERHRMRRLGIRIWRTFRPENAARRSALRNAGHSCV